MEEVYLFKPRRRVLFDLALGVAVGSLLISLPGIIPVNVIMCVSGGVIFLLVLLWIFWVRPAFRVVIAKGQITGPSPWGLKRVSFPLRKLDHTKLLRRTRKQKWLGYRDLRSHTGECIRLWRWFLGKPAIYDIMEIAEKYPFRDSA